MSALSDDEIEKRLFGVPNTSGNSRQRRVRRRSRSRWLKAAIEEKWNKVNREARRLGVRYKVDGTPVDDKIGVALGFYQQRSKF